MSGAVWSDLDGDGRPELILACEAGPIWLYADPAGDGCVAGYLGHQSTSLTLTTPNGAISVSGMGTGTMIWRNGSVIVESVGSPQVTSENQTEGAGGS